MQNLPSQVHKGIHGEPVEQCRVSLHLGQIRHLRRTHGAGKGVAHPITSASFTTSATIATTFTPVPS